ncbi:MAG: hypothetical protein IBX72_09930 [Nitrospirae bacterium]|nr:hypothetical protein [Nitrospirota bacterium]
MRLGEVSKLLKRRQMLEVSKVEEMEPQGISSNQAAHLVYGILEDNHRGLAKNTTSIRKNNLSKLNNDIICWLESL